MQEGNSSEALLRMRSDKPAYTAASLVTSFKLDEGYSDDSKSQLEAEAANESSFLPDWILASSEAERAGACVLRACVQSHHRCFVINTNPHLQGLLILY